jgi:hypothetical protein
MEVGGRETVTNSMKLRLLFMGCIITFIGALLVIARGAAISFEGFALLGVLLIVAGLLWR